MMSTRQRFCYHYILFWSLKRLLSLGTSERRKHTAVTMFFKLRQKCKKMVLDILNTFWSRLTL